MDQLQVSEDVLYIHGWLAKNCTFYVSPYLPLAKPNLFFLIFFFLPHPSKLNK